MKIMVSFASRPFTQSPQERRQRGPDSRFGGEKMLILLPVIEPVLSGLQLGREKYHYHFFLKISNFFFDQH
jgi:hypothetical protein